MSIAIRYAKNKEDAEWLVNESFLKVFLNFKQFDVKKEFRPWLRRILINTILNANKKNILEIPLDEQVEVEDSSHESGLDKISYDEIIAEIQGLTAGYRTVLNLYLIEGYKHHEIADLLNISVGTSKSNLHKARKTLQDKLILKGIE